MTANDDATTSSILRFELLPGNHRRIRPTRDLSIETVFTCYNRYHGCLTQYTTNLGPLTIDNDNDNMIVKFLMKDVIGLWCHRHQNDWSSLSSNFASETALLSRWENFMLTSEKVHEYSSHSEKNAVKSSYSEKIHSQSQLNEKIFSHSLIYEKIAGPAFTFEKIASPTSGCTWCAERETVRAHTHLYTSCIPI